jgi:hypothetical protein
MIDVSSAKKDILHIPVEDACLVYPIVGTVHLPHLESVSTVVGSSISPPPHLQEPPVSLVPVIVRPAMFWDVKFVPMVTFSSEDNATSSVSIHVPLAVLRMLRSALLVWLDSLSNQQQIHAPQILFVMDLVSFVPSEL